MKSIANDKHPDASGRGAASKGADTEGISRRYAEDEIDTIVINIPKDRIDEYAAFMKEMRTDTVTFTLKKDVLAEQIMSFFDSTGTSAGTLADLFLGISFNYLNAAYGTDIYTDDDIHHFKQTAFSAIFPGDDSDA